MPNWTPEMDTLLLSLYATTNAQDIADMIGKTRNAVIGRYNRIKVTDVPKPKRVRPSRAVVKPVEPAAYMPWADLPEKYFCRWPVGKGACGKPCVSRYCQTHTEKSKRKESGQKSGVGV